VTARRIENASLRKEKTQDKFYQAEFQRKTFEFSLGTTVEKCRDLHDVEFARKTVSHFYLRRNFFGKKPAVTY
jgi:hypothetical protein